MANESTTEVLVRTVVLISPDGNSVKTVERMTVEILWPNGRPKGDHSYMIAGTWQVTDGEVSDVR